MSAQIIPLKKTKRVRAQSRRERLTAAKLKSLKPPKMGETIVWDREVLGLGVRMTAKGARTYIVKRWNPEKRQTVKVALSPVGSISLEAARKQARDLLETGLELNAAKRLQATKEMKVALAFEQAMAEKSVKSVSQYRDVWRRYISPTGLGEMRITEVDTATVERLVIDPLRRRGKKSTSDHARTVLVMVWKWAIKRGHVTSDPVQAIARVATRPRDRVLDEKEQAALVEALEKDVVGEPWCDFFRILMATGQRKTATMRMNWADINFETRRWTIPRDDAKSGTPTTVTLNRAAIKVLERRRKTDPAATWVFPSSKDPSKPITSPQKAWAKLCAAAGIHGATIHDIRRTVGTRAGRAGMSAHQIGALLGHRSIQSSKPYVHLEGASEDVAEGASLLPLSDVGVVTMSIDDPPLDDFKEEVLAKVAAACTEVVESCPPDLLGELLDATNSAAFRPDFLPNADAYAALLAHVDSALKTYLPEKFPRGTGTVSKDERKKSAANLAKSLASIVGLYSPADTSSAIKRARTVTRL